MTKQIRTEMNQVIDALEKKGIDVNSHFGDTKGLGDVVEETLKSLESLNKDLKIGLD